MIDIKFSLSGSTADKDVIHQARAVVATMHFLFGDAVLPAATAKPPAMPSSTPPVVAGSTVSSNAPASDGHPMTAVEVDAATAFGAPSSSDDDDTGPVATVEPGERDKNGLPWDERIHASTKAKNADGTWRNRRNLDKAVLEAVTAELQAANTARTMEAAKGLASPPPPPPATTTAPPPPPPGNAPTSPAAAPVPSPAPVAPSASSTSPAATDDWSKPATTFAEVMAKVTRAQAAGKINPDGVKNLLGSLGLATIVDLNKAPENIPGFDALLVDHITNVAA